MANGVAAMLRSADADPERPVALLLQDMILCIAAMLGAAKTGRIYIPLDLGFPEAWLAQTLDTAEAAILFTDAHTAPIAGRVTGEHVRVLELDQALLRRGNVSRPPKALARDAQAPAFILFTSGSTGKPKGVIHSHEFLVHQADAWSGGVPIGLQDRVSLVYSCAFAAGIISTFVALLGGASLYPFDLRARGLLEFSTWLADKRISVISMTSSLFRTWLAAVPKDLRYPALRLIRNVSEPVYSDDIARAATHLGDSALVSQSLAMSEAGTVAVHTARPSVPRDPGVQPVGTPVRNMEIRLENEDGTVLGPGEVGEIVLRSRYLSLGYWKDPETTAANFRTDPVDPTLRLYRTGDLGRWRSDGDLEYFGRRDRKVKVRGYTVELYEIERALLRIPGVQDTAVILDQDRPQDPRLLAYVVATGEIALEGGKYFRELLAKELPAYMVPAYVGVLEKMPLTSRGKVDRGALPSPPSRDARSENYRAPSDEHERALAQIWETTLEIPEVGVDDDFYELGGTSLQGFLIFTAIAATFGHDLPPTTMIDAPTVAKQAELLRDPSRAAAPTQLLAFRPRGSGPPLFIVHGAYGGIMFVREVVRDLKSDRPVYGLLPMPLDGKHIIPRTVQSIAAGYIAEIRRARPHGPYLLSGYSSGGWIAYEMAQQLMQQGETVSFLAMIDTVSDQWKTDANEVSADRVKRHLRAVQRQNMFRIVPYLAKRIMGTIRHHFHVVKRIFTHLPNLIRMFTGRPSPYTERRTFYYWLFSRAARTYSPKPFAGPLIIFSSKGQSEWHKKRSGPLALGGLTVKEIPAKHLEMVWPPYSTMLAEAFDAFLDPKAG
jgi:amino acid adenylation domain-containing protein